MSENSEECKGGCTFSKSMDQESPRKCVLCGKPEKIDLVLKTKPEPMLQFFKWHHLPTHLQAVSAPFSTMANELVDTLPSNPERTAALRKLLEAKDCAVRALLYK